jgi:ribosomal protein S18 acetylase RimI-like enzyme
MRRATSKDVPALVTLMAEFYGESGYLLDRAHAEKAFDALLSDERLGHVWLMEDAGTTVGYVVLTLRFGMEYGGMMACLDDLYVVPACRNRGLSKAALSEIREFCKVAGVRAITVEVSCNNAPAQAVYRWLGLTERHDRQL